VRERGRGAVQVNNALRELHLSYNRVKETGAVALAGAVALNTTLHTLRLADNEINETGAHKLAEALQVCERE
jgi:Ran GTPase-activating protein (RanGAP) involved in mRNA processing and transport